MTFLLHTAIPVVALMALAIGLPYLWALVLPEGVGGLIANAVLSVVVIAVAVSTYLLAWYGRMGAVSWPTLAWFLGLWVAKTALAWVPMLVLGLAAQPRRWKEVVW